MSNKKAKIAVYAGLFFSTLLTTQSIGMIISVLRSQSFSHHNTSSLLVLAGSIAGTILGMILFSIFLQVKNNLPRENEVPPLPGNYKQNDRATLPNDLERKVISLNDSLRALVFPPGTPGPPLTEFHSFVRNHAVDRDAMARSVCLLKEQAPDDYVPRFEISSWSPIWTKTQSTEVLIPTEILGRVVFQKWEQREHQWELDSLKFLESLQEALSSNFA